MFCYTYENGTLTNNIDVTTPAFITPSGTGHQLLFYTREGHALSHAKAGRTPAGLQLDQEGNFDVLVEGSGVGEDKRALLWLKYLPDPKGCWEADNSRVLAGDGGNNTLLIVPNGGEVHFVLRLLKFDTDTGDLTSRNWENVFTFTNHNGKVSRKETLAIEGYKASREGQVQWL